MYSIFLRSFRGVEVNVRDFNFKVCEFELQSYVHFLTNKLGKEIKLLILPAMG